MPTKNSAVDLERAVLGAVFVNEKLFYSIKGRLTAPDFFDKRNALIFAAIEKTYDDGIEDIELAPIINLLKSENNLKMAGGEDYIGQLMEFAGLPSNINKYIKEIANKADLRNVKVLLEKARKEAETSASAEDILDIIEQKVVSIARGVELKGFISSKEGIDEAIKALEARATGELVVGVSTGFSKLDEIIGGFQKGDLIILAARPSMGKTALALNIAANIAKEHNVAFFSLEMPSIQLWTRILANASYVSGNKIKNSKTLSPQENQKIYIAKDKLEKMNLYIDDTAGIKLTDLVWKAKRLAKNIGLDAIFIDYLQLIVASNSSDSLNRQNEISVISRTLKKLARDLNVPVIALSQLSRRVEQRESKIPMMSDLRESGAIEQDADLIAFIYRESYYNKEKKDDIASVIISKHRNGALGEADFFFNPSHGSFIEKGE